MTTGGPGAVAGPVRDAGPAGPPVVLGDLGIEPELRSARWSQLDPVTAEGLLRLRGQTAPDAEDLDPATEQVWLPDAGTPVAALRVRPAPGGPGSHGTLVERLVVREDVRQLGLGSALLADTVARHGAAELVADVPEGVRRTFERFGFDPVPGSADRMRRAPDAPWRED